MQQCWIIEEYIAQYIIFILWYSLKLLCSESRYNSMGLDYNTHINTICFGLEWNCARPKHARVPLRCGLPKPRQKAIHMGAVCLGLRKGDG